MEKNEQVVFMKDLLFAALYRWRQMLVAGLVLALLLGAFAGFLEWKKLPSEASEEEKTTAMQNYEQKRQQLEKKAEHCSVLVDNQRAYNTESALMQVNPYQVYKAAIDITVWPPKSTDNTDPAGAVLKLYAAQLTADKMIREAAQAVDIQSKYLAELVQVSNGGLENRTLTITVRAATQEDTQKILDVLCSGVETVKQQLKYDTTVIVSGVDQRIDLGLLDQQKQAQTRLKDLNTQLTDAQNELEALKAPVTATGISKKKIVIFAVLGALLGIMLVAGLAGLRHIAGGVVYSGRTLKNCTGVKLLGCLMLTEPKCRVDRWLRKLEGRCITDESAVVAATVKNYCAKGQKLLVVGSCGQANAKMTQLLKNADICLESCGSLLRSPQALTALPQCDAVLLVEQCGSSKYQDVLLALERIEDQEKPVIGCVLLDG